MTRTALVAFAALAMLWAASLTGAAQTETPGNRPSKPKETRARQLVSMLHHPDAAVVLKAETQLRQLGMTVTQLQLARQLSDPDPKVRIELAKYLINADIQTQNEFYSEILYDPVPKVRRAALEAVERVSPGVKLKRRVLEIAATDGDPVVRGYARLISAKWNLQTISVPKLPEGGVRQADVFAGPSGVRPTLAGRPRAISADRAPVSTIPRPFPEIAGGGTQPRSLRTAGGKSAFQPTHPIATPQRATTVAGVTGKDRAFGKGRFGGKPTADDIRPRSAIEPIVPTEFKGVELLPPQLPGSNGPVPLDTPFYRQAYKDFGSTAPPLPQNLQGVNPITKPDVLDRPLQPLTDELPSISDEEWPNLPPLVPLGFTGPSGVMPSESRESAHFVPTEDRWRNPIPPWDRYGREHPWVDDYPFVEGHWWDPFNQNVLKGDYPIIGRHTFLNLTATSMSVDEFRRVPTATTPFESTSDPFQEEFFGDSDQFVHSHYLKFSVQLFHGNTAFKPLDWQVKVTPVFNYNYLDVDELGVVAPDVRKGSTRYDDFFSLEEWFAEAKIADLGPDYDFASVRVGSQFFTSDFRGFIFSDTNRAYRLFGTRLGNRDQFNIIWFDQLEKDTNSELNTFHDRNQNTLIVNYYRQDFIFPGYTAQASFHYNRDKPDFQFDDNNFLVRPDPVGVFQPHDVQAYYFGFAGDGHIGRYNITNAFYWVVGQDSLNPLASDQQDISAQMAAIELSYDRDWMRFRVSYLWASGDDDPDDDKARGFDSIFDNPNFAGGEFSYWQRQAIRLFGANLVNAKSIVPDLRSSKIQGQSNFVNPGLNLLNFGMDADITPKLKLISNLNFLWFDSTEVLETFTFQDFISSRIGTDISLGVEYRPLLNDNIQIIGGFAGFLPAEGFRNLYNAFNADAESLYASFLEVILTF